MMQNYQLQAGKAFKNYYRLNDGSSGRQIRPICGDYLANVALVMQNEVKNNEEE